MAPWRTPCRTGKCMGRLMAIPLDSSRRLGVPSFNDMPETTMDPFPVELDQESLVPDCVKGLSDVQEGNKCLLAMLT